MCIVSKKDLLRHDDSCFEVFLSESSSGNDSSVSETAITFAAEISNYSTIYCRCYNVVDAKAIKNCVMRTMGMGFSLFSLLPHGSYQSQSESEKDREREL